MKKLIPLLLTVSCLCCAVQPTAIVYTQLVRARTSSVELQNIESRIKPILEVADVELSQALSVVSAIDEGLSSPDIILVSNEIGRRKVTLKVRGKSYAAIFDALAQQAKAIWWIDGAVYFEEQK